MVDRQVRLGGRFAVSAMLGLFAMAMSVPASEAADAPNADLVAKGRYLSDAGDCMACHTKAGGEPFAGGKYLETPFGPLSTPNITPDPETGIGKVSDDQFYRVFHQGIGAGGEYLYPAMPYPWYTKVTRDDVLAIKAYLMTVKPVHSERLPSKMAFPFNIRTGLLAWNQAFFHEGTFKPDPGKSAEINRGAYLVQGLGHCGECHNGNSLLGAGGAAGQLQGGSIQNWYAPNITSDVHQGVGKYTDDQLVSYLKTGQAQGMGAASGPMAETVHDSLSKLTDPDLHAIVAYLKSTRAETTYVSTERSGYTGQAPAGRETYLNYCSSCHQPDGKGLQGAVAPLVNNGAVLAKGPQDVVRTILGGIEAKNTDAPMPAIGQGMTDQQIADATNYVRQAWGNKAPPNAGSGTAGELRKTTPVALYGSVNGQCPAVEPADIAAAVKDPKTGIQAALQKITQGTVLQTVELIVPKLKAAVPQAKPADLVNGLTLAYCPVLRQDATIPQQQKATEIGQFSERVYSELHSSGKE